METPIHTQFFELLKMNKTAYESGKFKEIFTKDNSSKFHNASKYPTNLNEGLISTCQNCDTG